MIANNRFSNQSLEFWANIKLLSQESKYTERGTGNIKTISLSEIEIVFEKHQLSLDKIYCNDNITGLGKLILDYFEYRAKVLNTTVKSSLMNKDQAALLFNQLKEKLSPRCPLPLNKQKGIKKAPAYFTGIINMLIESNLNGQACDFDPRRLISFTEGNYPARNLSRRVDGAFPETNNPIAIWEVKEYYNTTTFGSRVADGVYETLLDGYELAEIRMNTSHKTKHYLLIDDYNTWWNMGKSYLCRIIDMLNMGLITEVMFGQEVLSRLPEVVKTEWLNSENYQKDHFKK
jgi:hypothetical protein